MYLSKVSLQGITLCRQRAWVPSSDRTRIIMNRSDKGEALKLTNQSKNSALSGSKHG